MIYKYAQIYETPIAEEVVYAMTKLCEGNPLYVSSIFETANRSPAPFVFSRKGFKQGVPEYFQEQGIAYSNDDGWLGY